MIEPPRSWQVNRLLLFVLAAALLRLALAALVTDFVLVDDAYIHLRYARNLVTTGALVYNPGEAVFGVTSPSFVLLSALLYAAFGDAVSVATVCLSILLWTALTLMLARNVTGAARAPIVVCVSLLSVFVDNQLLGMESALFTLLLAGAGFSVQRGRIQAAAAWYGLGLITRPEAVLFAPWLLWSALSRSKQSDGVERAPLRAPRFWLTVLTPGLLWCTFAWLKYGTIVPQSMLAKTGWNNGHYEALSTATAAIVALPRLTFLPFVDHLPETAKYAAASLIALFVALITRANWKGGDRGARMWLGFYATYLAFFLLGKGATEASWYAVPSSFAVLLAARPWLETVVLRLQHGPRGAGAVFAAGALLTVGAATASVTLALKRAPLLRYYWEGYGVCAAELLRDPRFAGSHAPRVVIGEIGVFGFAWPGPVTDLGALVSPEVLPWKNSGASFVQCVQRSGASAFVISERALRTNEYPSLSCTVADAAERAWLERCELVATALDKRAYYVPESLRPTP